MYNLSNSKKSLTAKVEYLIGRMATMTDLEIRAEFTAILDSEDTYVSDATMAKWAEVINTSSGKNKIMIAICNLHLAGCGLKIS